MTPLLAAIDSLNGMFWFYAGFTGLVFGFLAVDLGVFHRKAHEVSVKEAAAWTVVWVIAALAFNLFITLPTSTTGLGLAGKSPSWTEPHVTCMGSRPRSSF